MGIDQAFSSVTMEHITLLNQSKAGFQLMQNIASIRDLTSVNTVPVIVATGTSALVVLDGIFSGGAGGSAAITMRSPGQMYLRNIINSGYGAISAKNGSTVAAGGSLTEYSSSAPVSAFSTPAQALTLPIQETPEYSDNNFANWANVKRYGAVGDGNHDDAPALQASIDSGKSTVYLPFGTYKFGSQVIVRGNVCILRGFGGTISDDGTFSYTPFKIQNTSFP